MSSSDYSIYQKPSTWISRFSSRAKCIMVKYHRHPNQQVMDQLSILSAPGSLSSPDSSGFTSVDLNDDNDDNDDNDFITPSPSSSTSSWSSTSRYSAKLSPNKQHDHQLPPSPTLTACDQTDTSPLPSLSLSLSPPCPTVARSIPTTSLQYYPNYLSSSLSTLKRNDYFNDRPLPTQRRSPGRHRHFSINSSSSSLSCGKEELASSRQSSALEKLAQDALTYFLDAPSSTSQSLSLSGTLTGSNQHDATDLIEKLQSKLIDTTTIHPSVLKLAQDTLSFMVETPPMTEECQQLKPKLEVCLLIHGKNVK